MITGSITEDITFHIVSDILSGDEDTNFYSFDDDLKSPYSFNDSLTINRNLEDA